MNMKELDKEEYLLIILVFSVFSIKTCGLRKMWVENFTASIYKFLVLFQSHAITWCTYIH